MHPEFLNKYGSKLQKLIELLAAYYSIDFLFLEHNQLTNKDTINKAGLMALCEETDFSYSALLNYAQQGDEFPIAANQAMTKFARFSDSTEVQPFHQISVMTLQPEGLKFHTANCGLACWNQNSEVLTTAFYDVFNKGERGFSLARYNYNEGSWQIQNKLLYGNIVQLKEMENRITIKHGDTITKVEVTDINQLAVIT